MLQGRVEAGTQMPLELSLHLLSLLSLTPDICETQGERTNGDPHTPCLHTGALQAKLTNAYLRDGLVILLGKPSLSLAFSDS